MNVMNMDISSWTTLTEYHLQEHQHHTTKLIEITTPGQVQGITRKTEKEETGPDHSPDTANIIAPAILTCTESTPDHNNGTGTTAIELTQDDSIQHTGDTAAGHAMTHHTSHTANPLHTTAHQATTLRIPVDHTHDHLTDHQNIVHTQFRIILQTEKPKIPSKEECKGPGRRATIRLLEFR